MVISYLNNLYFKEIKGFNRIATFAFFMNVRLVIQIFVRHPLNMFDILLTSLQYFQPKTQQKFNLYSAIPIYFTFVLTLIFK